MKFSVIISCAALCCGLWTGCSKQRDEQPRPQGVAVDMHLSSREVADATQQPRSSATQQPRSSEPQVRASLPLAIGTEILVGIQQPTETEFFVSNLYRVAEVGGLQGETLYLLPGTYTFTGWAPAIASDAATRTVPVNHGTDFITATHLQQITWADAAGGGSQVTLPVFDHKCTRLEAVAVRAANNTSVSSVEMSNLGLRIDNMAAQPALYTIGGAIATEADPSGTATLAYTAFTPLPGTAPGTSGAGIFLPKAEKGLKFTFNLLLDGELTPLAGTTPPMSLFAGVGYKFTIRIEEYVAKLTLTLTDWTGREIANEMGGGTELTIDQWVEQVLEGEVSMGQGTTIVLGEWTITEVDNDTGTGTRFIIGEWTSNNWNASLGG